MAVRKGLKLSEYGLFEAKTGELIVPETEEEVYERLGLPWIPPTCARTGARSRRRCAGELPDAGDWSRTSRATCTRTPTSPTGCRTLEEMVGRGGERGYAYYAVTDHAPNLCMQRMTDEKMLAQRDQVRKLPGDGTRR